MEVQVLGQWGYFSGQKGENPANRVKMRGNPTKKWGN